MLNTAYRLMVMAALAAPASLGCNPAPLEPPRLPSTGNLSFDLEREKIHRDDKRMREHDPTYAPRLDRLDQFQREFSTLTWRRGIPRTETMVLYEAEMGTVHVELTRSQPKPGRAEQYILSATHHVDGSSKSWLLLALSHYAEKFFKDVDAKKLP